jgi:UDP-N-acetylglucosamine 2-epimerase (non-hydrolysing)
MAAFYTGVPVAHVEAGLRTGDITTPWPEEANRVLVSRIAAIHFPPTSLAERNLIEEGVPAEKVFNVGNTVIDAAHMAAGIIAGQNGRFGAKFGDLEDNSILFTMHRRESIGEPMERAFGAMADLARATGCRIVFPMHPNPKVRGPANRILGDLDNVVLCEPLDYDELIHVLRSCRAVVTDSGGIVEEAAAFNKPALVLRETTERTESVDAGSAILCGTDPVRIHELAIQLLADTPLHEKMTTAVNPFGDGTAAKQIVETLRSRI